MYYLLRNVSIVNSDEAIRAYSVGAVLVGVTGEVIGPISGGAPLWPGMRYQTHTEQRH